MARGSVDRSHYRAGGEAGRGGRARLGAARLRRRVLTGFLVGRTRLTLSVAWTAARDGYPANPDNIYLTAGASAGVSLIMNVAVRPGDGVL